MSSDRILVDVLRMC